MGQTNCRSSGQATREADNQAAFVQRLQAEVQLDVRVIAGLEEARLIYLGVSHGVHLGTSRRSLSILAVAARK